MTQNSTALSFSKILYNPDWLEKSELLNSMKKTAPLDYFHQIEFSENGVISVFPDFENIFSRSILANEWWFLPLECDGVAICQEEDEVSNWWEYFQDIYDKWILQKVPCPRKEFDPFLALVTTYLIGQLYDDLNYSKGSDDRDTQELHAIFCRNLIEEEWNTWLWKKAVINYYHILFPPTLNKKIHYRKVARLYNRFPEYADAYNWLGALQEYIDRDDLNTLFEKEASIESLQNLKFNATFSKSSRLSFHQCRVCGVVWSVTKKVREGKSKSIQTCSDGCKSRLKSLLGQLPINPNDLDNKNFLLSHL